MSFFVFEKDGESHACYSGNDFFKAMGASGYRSMVMVDEGGNLVAAGNSLGALHQSVDMVKSLTTEAAPMRKSVVVYRPGAEPMRKSKSAGTDFNKLLSELESLSALRKAHSSDDDGDDEKQTLASLVETQRKQIASLERALAKMQSRLG